MSLSDMVRIGRVEEISSSKTGNKKQQLLALQHWTHNFVFDRLRAPLLGSDLRLAADQCAERYIFEEDATQITRSLVKSGVIPDDVIWDSLRLPATNVWIEYPVAPEVCAERIDRIGIMLGMVPHVESILTNHRLMMAIVMRTMGGAIRTVALQSFPDGNRIIRNQTYVHLHWYLDHLASDGRTRNDEGDADCKGFVYDLVDSMFLINTPRVCEVREGHFGSRKPKVAERTGVPLIEYKSLKIKVGVGTPQYRNGGSRGLSSDRETDEERRHKLHRVVGHFRVYKKNRDTPEPVFVPQHWRGDPALGVVLHDRKIVR